jgi:CHAD domain-containing protein
LTAAGGTRPGPSTAFALTRAEPVDLGVARMARGRLSHALDELEGRSGSSSEKAVHEARKDLKKLRSLVRLVRGPKDESAALRDIGRSLSGLRDADVMLATLTDLEERLPQLPADVAGGLRQALEAHREALPAGDAAGAVEALRDAHARVPHWVPEGDGFGVLRAGLEREYRRGRRAARAARSDPTDERLHEWRKRAKDQWYHLTILVDVWPPVMEPLAGAAHDLSDRLGDDHDLALLLGFARSRADALGGAERVDALAEAIAPRREELRSEAFALGARLYADKPGAYGARMKRFWRAWRAPAVARRGGDPC